MKERICEILNSGTSNSKIYLEEIIRRYAEDKVEDPTMESMIDLFLSMDEDYGSFGIIVWGGGGDGRETLTYGQYENGVQSIPPTFCDLDSLLEIMESRDSVPRWYDSDWVLVVDGNNSYVQRGQLEYLAEEKAYQMQNCF